MGYAYPQICFLNTVLLYPPPSPFFSLSHSSLGFTDEEKVTGTDEKGKERVERHAEVSNDADRRSLTPVTSSPLSFQIEY